MRQATTLELYALDKNKITHQPPQNKDGSAFNNFANRGRKFGGLQVPFNKDRKFGG